MATAEESAPLLKSGTRRDSENSMKESRREGGQGEIKGGGEGKGRGGRAGPPL